MNKNTMCSLHVGVVSLRLEAEFKTSFFYKNWIANIENSLTSSINQLLNYTIA